MKRRSSRNLHKEFRQRDPHRRGTPLYLSEKMCLDKHTHTRTHTHTLTYMAQCGLHKLTQKYIERERVRHTETNVTHKLCTWGLAGSAGLLVLVSVMTLAPLHGALSSLSS